MKHEELDFEKRCREAARREGWVAVKLEKNGNKGIPDDLFISPNGRVIFIEFKKNTKIKPRKEQILWLERYPNLCHLVGDFETFCKIIKS